MQFFHKWFEVKVSLPELGPREVGSPYQKRVHSKKCLDLVKDWQKVDFLLKIKIWDTWTKKTDLLQGLEIHLKKAAGITDLKNDSTKPMMDVSTQAGKEGEDMHPEGQAAGRSEGSMRKSQQQILVTCS